MKTISRAFSIFGFFIFFLWFVGAIGVGEFRLYYGQEFNCEKFQR